MTQYLTCQPKDVPASEAPCFDVEGVHYGVVVVDDGLGQIVQADMQSLFVWSFSLVVVGFFVGFCIGSIIKLIRSA